MASRFATRFLTRSTRVGAAGGFRSAASKTRVTAAPGRTALFAQSRSYSGASASTANASRSQYIWAGVAAGAGVALYSYTSAEEKVDYEAVRAAIAELLEDDSHDDGSWGPILVRLAWHASGTFDKNTCTGGSDGATMRFSPECHHGANAGLALARTRLESVKRRFPGISYADLWTLAGAVAIEEMGGPKIHWRPGRSDADSSKACPPDGRLPDAAQGQDHVRDVFYRMGFNDREIVALVGAHALGRCHTSRSGYSGPWTNAPTTFSNDYFVQLSERKWTVKKWSGPKQYEDESGMLMMLPADMALFEDPKFRAVVLEYAADEEAFFRDFASAFSRLMELGCKDLGGSGFVHQLFDLSSR